MPPNASFFVFGLVPEALELRNFSRISFVNFFSLIRLIYWSGRRDSNQRQPAVKNTKGFSLEFARGS